MVSRDLIQTLRPFLRGLPFTLALVVVAVMAMGKYVSYLTPYYESTARIKLADNQVGPTGSHLYDDMDFFATENKIAAEIELIKSNTILEKVVDRLPEHYLIYRVGDLHSTELYDQSPILIHSLINDSMLLEHPFELEVQGEKLHLVAPDENVYQGRLGKAITVNGSEILITRNDALLRRKPKMHIDDKYRFVFKSREKLLAEIRSNLDVMAADKDVPVLRISYKSSVARKAMDVVNLVSNCYIQDYVDTKFQTADTTVNFLKEQLDRYTTELNASEVDIEQYRNRENIINIRQETETDLRKIADMKKQLANLEIHIAAIDSLDQYIQAGTERFLQLAPNFEAFNDLLSTELVKKIKAYQAERNELLTLYTPEHEKIRVIDANVKEIIVYIKESIRNTRRNNEIKIDVLRGSIADAESAFVGLPTREKTLEGLERTNQMNEAIFRFLHEKKTEAEIARAARISFHRIIDFGSLPKAPSSPKPSLLKALAAFLAFLIGVLMSWFMHKRKFRMGGEGTVQQQSLIPIHISVPHLKDPSRRKVHFSQWASALWLNGSFESGRIQAFLEMQSGSQKGFVMHELALALSRMGKSVLILTPDVDAMQHFGKHPYTIRNVSEVFQAQNGPDASVLSSFECVLLDAGCFADSEDSMMLLSHTARCFIVLDQLGSTPEDIDQANALQELVPALALEFVYNRSQYFPWFLDKSNVLAVVRMVREKLAARMASKPRLIVQKRMDA
jgi:uncharacterized protein involved in exopolysaccharide biosynthesis